MSQLVDARPVTSALLATLQAGVGYPIGDHEPPSDTSERYCILWGIPGGEISGSWNAPHENAIMVFQIDSSGRSRDQCQWLTDKVRQVVLQRSGEGWTYPIAITGLRVSYRDQRIVGQPENEGRDERGTTLFTCRDRFELTVVQG